jgi:hypothetical protein
MQWAYDFAADMGDGEVIDEKGFGAIDDAPPWSVTSPTTMAR